MKIELDLDELTNWQDNWRWYVGFGTVIWYVTAGIYCKHAFGKDACRRIDGEEYVCYWIFSPIIAAGIVAVMLLVVLVAFPISVLLWILSVGYTPPFWEWKEFKGKK